MTSVLKKYSFIVALIASLFLMGADNGGQGTDDRERLLEQQRQLNARIEMLKRDQAFLLFQKSLYALDSKYLILNMSTKKGQLKYKNRILKDFQITRLPGRAVMPAPGAVTLTDKIEEPKERNALVFGRSFILQGRRTPAARIDAGIPRFALPKKDFLSVFYAVEAGGKAYILP